MPSLPLYESTQTLSNREALRHTKLSQAQNQQHRRYKKGLFL